jgi:hypothetical protein
MGKKQAFPCRSDAPVAMTPRRPPPIAPGVGLLQNAGQPLHGQKQAFPCGSDALVAMKPCRPPPIAHGAGLQHLCQRRRDEGLEKKREYLCFCTVKFQTF